MGAKVAGRRSKKETLVPTVSRDTSGTYHDDQSTISNGTCETDISGPFLLRGQYEVDAAESTPLFDAICLKDWTRAQHFLETGKFSIFSFKEKETPAQMASTWVTRSIQRNDDDSFDSRDSRLDDKGRIIQWRQLPIHRAIVNKAPPSFLAVLVQVYPRALLCPDSKENLPLHLAFKYDIDDSGKATLLKASPWTAMDATNEDGLTPVDCLGYNKSKPANARKKIYKVTMEQAASSAKVKENAIREQLADVKKKVEAATTELGLAVIDLKIEKVRARAEEEWHEQNRAAALDGLNEQFSQNGLSCKFSQDGGEKSIISKLTFFS